MRRRAKPAAVDRRIAERRELEARLDALLGDALGAVEAVDDFVDAVGNRGALLMPALLRALGSPDPRRRALVRAILAAVLDADALEVLAREARRPDVPPGVRQDAFVLGLTVDPEGRAGALTPDEAERAAQGSLRAVLDGLLLDPSSSDEISALYRDLPPEARAAAIEEAARAEPGADAAAIDARKLLVATALRRVEDDPALRERIVDLVASASAPEALFALGLVEKDARDDAEARAARRHAMRLRTAGHAPRDRIGVALRTGCDPEGRVVLALARPDVAGHWDVVAMRLSSAGALEEVVRQRVGPDPTEALDRTGILPHDVPIAPAPWSEVAQATAAALQGALGVPPEIDVAFRRAAGEPGDETPSWPEPALANRPPDAQWIERERALAGWRVDPPESVRVEAARRAADLVEKSGGREAKILRDLREFARGRLGEIPPAVWRETERRVRLQARAIAASGDDARARRLAAAAETLRVSPPSGDLAEVLAARGLFAALFPEEPDADDDAVRVPLRAVLYEEADGPITKKHLIALDVACVASGAILEALPHLEKSRNDLGRVLFAALALGRAVADVLAAPRTIRGLPIVASMPAETAFGIQDALERTIREHLADVGTTARRSVALEVLSFVRALCYGECPHGCPARPGEPARDLCDMPAPWEAD